MPQAFQKVPPWSQRIYTPGTHQAHCHPAISLKRAALFSSALLMSAEEGGRHSPLPPPLALRTHERTGSVPGHPTMH